MRGEFFLVLLLWAATAVAQTMYKCVDGGRRITYSNIACEKQGLKDAGPVADRTTSMPFPSAPKPAPSANPSAAKSAVKPPASGATDEAETGRGTTQIKPVNPVIQKLTQ